MTPHTRLAEIATRAARCTDPGRIPDHGDLIALATDAVWLLERMKEMKNGK